MCFARVKQKPAAENILDNFASNSLLSVQFFIQFRHDKWYVYSGSWVGWCMVWCGAMAGVCKSIGHCGLVDKQFTNYYCINKRDIAACIMAHKYPAVRLLSSVSKSSVVGCCVGKGKMSQRSARFIIAIPTYSLSENILE